MLEWSLELVQRVTWAHSCTCDDEKGMQVLRGLWSVHGVMMMITISGDDDAGGQHSRTHCVWCSYR